MHIQYALYSTGRRLLTEREVVHALNRLASGVSVLSEEDSTVSTLQHCPLKKEEADCLDSPQRHPSRDEAVCVEWCHAKVTVPVCCIKPRFLNQSLLIKQTRQGSGLIAGQSS